MKQIGGYMFFFGVGSIVLYFLNMEFILLAWIDTWGEPVAWSIRGVLTVAGGIMWFIGRNQEAH